MYVNVLSLFDGCRMGRISLNKANIKVRKYYSSEIEDSSISVADKNHPQDKNDKLGTVMNWEKWNIDWASVDLLIGGSP